MASQIICDICQNVCQTDRYFQLTGWWGKGYLFPSSRRQKDAWRLELQAQAETLNADVCADCMENRLNITSFYPEEKRDVQLEKLRQKNPDLSGLKLLRKALGSVVEGIACDLCGSQCIDRFLQIKSSWLNADRASSTADLCESCVSDRLAPIVRFQHTTTPVQHQG